MKKLVFALLVLAAVAGGLWWLFCKPPAGYDHVLEWNSGKQPDTVSDPARYTTPAAQWAHDAPLKSLRFFESELSSQDPTHVKAGLYSLAFLTNAVDHTGDGEVSQEVKEAYDKALPVAKINALLAAHPEYAKWLLPLGHGKRAALFPAFDPDFYKSAGKEGR